MGCPQNSSEDRERWREPQVGHDPDLARRLGGELTKVQHLSRICHRPRQYAGEHDRSQGVELILEGRDDPKVAATAPEAPEQVGMLVLTRYEELAIRRDHIAGHQAVDREPKATHQVADPAPQSEPAGRYG